MSINTGYIDMRTEAEKEQDRKTNCRYCGNTVLRPCIAKQNTVQCPHLDPATRPLAWSQMLPLHHREGQS